MEEPAAAKKPRAFVEEDIFDFSNIKKVDTADNSSKPTSNLGAKSVSSGSAQKGFDDNDY